MTTIQIRVRYRGYSTAILQNLIRGVRECRDELRVPVSPSWARKIAVARVILRQRAAA